MFQVISEALESTLVPNHLGPHHLSRDQALENNTIFTKTFVGDKVTLILDGIFIGKSDDHTLQKKGAAARK